VPHLAHATGQSAANLTQALCLGNLAKQHGHEVVPGVKLLCEPLGLVPMNQPIEFFSVKQRYQLTEEARMSYHRSSSLALGDCFSWSINNIPQGGFFLQ